MGWKGGKKLSDAFRFPTSENATREVDAGLDDVVDEVFAASQRNVPVRRGTLKKSGDTIKRPLHKRVFYQTSYAEEIETTKLQMPGHPYLKPAYEDNAEWARGRMKEAMNRAIGR